MRWNSLTILMTVLALCSLVLAAIATEKRNQQKDLLEAYESRLAYKTAVVEIGHQPNDMPDKTVPLSTEQAGALKTSTELLIVRVHPDHKQWLLDMLNNIGGVEQIYDATTPASMGGTGQDCVYHVTFTPRIGKDDWDALFALPDILRSTALAYGPWSEIYYRYKKKDSL